MLFEEQEFTEELKHTVRLPNALGEATWYWVAIHERDKTWRTTFSVLQHEPKRDKKQIPLPIFTQETYGNGAGLVSEKASPAPQTVTVRCSGRMENGNDPQCKKGRRSTRRRQRILR